MASYMPSRPYPYIEHPSPDVARRNDLAFAATHHGLLPLRTTVNSPLFSQTAPQARYRQPVSPADMASSNAEEMEEFQRLSDKYQPSVEVGRTIAVVGVRN